MHREHIIREWNGKRFFLAHGDGLGPGDHGYKFLKKVFELKANQWLFRWLHPDIGTRLALYFSRKSRYANILKDKRLLEKEGQFDLSNERLYAFAKEYHKENPDVSYFIFGHRHYPGHVEIPEGGHYVNLGDWISNYSYALLDEQGLSLYTFKSGVKELLKGPF